MKFFFFFDYGEYGGWEWCWFFRCCGVCCLGFVECGLCGCGEVVGEVVYVCGCVDVVGW